MKKIQVSLVAIATLTGVTTFFAFKPSKSITGGLHWYSYTPTTVFTVASYNNPANYESLGSGTSDCSGTDQLCAVQTVSTAGGGPKLFAGFGTRVIAKEGVRTQTKVTSSAGTTVTVQYQSAE